MKVIVPCCGYSSRYPNMPPKWMLPDSRGIPMIVRCLEKFNFPLEDLVITVLREHEERFDVSKGLHAAFEYPVRIVILDEATRSQSETVAKTLRSIGATEPFLVKDSDNSFSLSEIDYSANYVSVASLNDFEVVNPRNKSYVTLDQDMIIASIHEKKVVSDLFSVGGYYFRDPAQFLDVYDRLESDQNSCASEIYISEIISYMLVQGEVFVARPVSGYEDWGTVHEWRRKLESTKLFLVSVDGFLFERGFLHFSPTFEDASPNADAVSAVKDLVGAGHSIIYLSIRPHSLERVTRDLLLAQGLPLAPIVMGCDMSQWALITSPHSSLPFVTSRSFEIIPDDENLVEKLIGSC